MLYGLISSIGTGQIILCTMEDLPAKVDELARDVECLFDWFGDLTEDGLQDFADIYTGRHPNYPVINESGVDIYARSIVRSR